MQNQQLLATSDPLEEKEDDNDALDFGDDDADDCPEDEAATVMDAAKGRALQGDNNRDLMHDAGNIVKSSKPQRLNSQQNPKVRDGERNMNTAATEGFGRPLTKH